MVLLVKGISVDWADRVGIQSSCRIAKTPKGYRGLVAKQAMRRGEAVLTVPRALTLSVSRTDESDPSLDWLTRLSLKLAEEFHAGQNSPHATFVKSLPAPAKSPHRWSEEELSFLHNDTLAAEATARRHLQKAEWKHVASGTQVPQRTFERAWELAASRVIGARCANGIRNEELLLVPMVDM